MRLESRHLNCDKSLLHPFVVFLPHNAKLYQVSDERYGAAEQREKNRSHICSIARKIYAWLIYVNFRKGRQSDER